MLVQEQNSGDGGGVLTGGRLVQEEHPRVSDQLDPNTRPFPFSTRHTLLSEHTATDPSVFAIAQPERHHDVIGTRQLLGGAHVL
jgi:hypothetical protein